MITASKSKVGCYQLTFNHPGSSLFIDFMDILHRTIVRLVHRHEKENKHSFYLMIECRLQDYNEKSFSLSLSLFPSLSVLFKLGEQFDVLMEKQMMVTFIALQSSFSSASFARIWFAALIRITFSWEDGERREKRRLRMKGGWIMVIYQVIENVFWAQFMDAAATRWWDARLTRRRERDTYTVHIQKNNGR